MAFMYPQHFPEIPILWNDSSWVVESEEFVEENMLASMEKQHETDDMPYVILNEIPEQSEVVAAEASDADEFEETEHEDDTNVNDTNTAPSA